MKKGLFLVGILLVPSIIYLLFSLGEHRTSRLGFEGAYTIAPNGDTVFNSVALPPLTDQHGSTITTHTIAGKAILVNPFRWPCDDACATSLTTLNNYLHDTGFESDWVLLNICLDSITTDDLRGLSEKTLYKGDNWLYAKSTDSVALARFITDCFTQDEETPILKTALLDQRQCVRTFFNLRYQQDNKKMGDAIKLLIQEPHLSWKEK